MRGYRILPLLVLAAAVALVLTGPVGRFVVYTPLLLLGPGYLLERWARPGVPALARPALWLGLSLALLPPIYLWATTLGVAITPYALFLFLLGTSLALLVVTTRIVTPRRVPAPAGDGEHGDFILGARDEGRGASEGDREGLHLYEEGASKDVHGEQPGSIKKIKSLRVLRVSVVHISFSSVLWGLLFVGVLALTAWTRVQHIRGMAFPPWVDAVHHALLIRIAGETGQAPISLLPYLPVEQSGYHWGYHVVAGALWRSTGLEIPRLMLWLGQVLSTLTVVSAAGCALALFRRPAAAVVAGAIPGLFSLMPAYLLSWGRYTLLMGLLVLCAVIMQAAQVLREPSARRMLPLALLLTGLSLIHFVLWIFALAWCAAVWLALAPGGRPARAFVALLSAVLLALAATLPWLLLLASLARPGSGGSPLQVVGNDPHNALPQGLFWNYLGRELMVLAALGAFWGLLRRSREALALVLWLLLLALLTNPVLVGLPYVSFLTNLMLVSMLFLPVSLLLGAGAGFLECKMQNAKSTTKRFFHFSFCILHSSGVRALAVLLILALLAVRAQVFQGVVNTGTTLADADDLRAISWVAEATPADARFVVNTRGWQPEVARGDDGGWWLLPLAARQVSTPPVIHNYGPDDYRAAVKEQTDWLRSHPEPAPEEVAAFMRRYGYGYAYATPEGPQLRSDQLRASPLFDPLFEAGRVTIFKLR
jgi:hypothetical protein